MEKKSNSNEITLSDPIVIKSREMLSKLLKEKVIKSAELSNKEDGLVELILRGQMTDKEKRQQDKEIAKS